MALSRRVFLLGATTVASATALTGCGKAPVNVTTPTSSPTGTARQQLDQLMTSYGSNTGQFGVAIRDLRTGVDWEFRKDYSSQSASMAKVMIVMMALRHARAQGGELPFERMTQASAAIIRSDNDSSDALWDYAGRRPAYAALAAELGLKHTRPDERRDFWSWTWTTPSDQRSLMQQLVSGTKALHDEDRYYLLDLMRKTQSDQTWGVGHPKSKQVQVQMKNGWVQFQSTDGLWAVNSLGRVHGEGRDYLACFMCRMPTFESGRELLDAVGADVWKALATELR